MKRFCFGIATLIVVGSAMAWSANPVYGQRGRGAPARAPVARAPVGHGIVHTGSVHYGARVAPVRAEAIRAEHLAVAERGHSYRNPYREEYFRRFRPGYHSFVLGGAQYYGYYGLPVGYQVVVINGITYYVLDGIYYQAYIYGGQTVYLVVPAPA